MNMFGFNLLNIAQSAIGFQEVQWYAFKDRVQNNRGHFEGKYHAPVTIKGSWQPVDRSVIKDMGFDVEKDYHNFYTSTPVQSLQRGTAPDKLIYKDPDTHQNMMYEVVGGADWYAQNGWRGIVCVYVGVE